MRRFVTLVVVVLIAAACGSSDSNSTTTTSATGGNDVTTTSGDATSTTATGGSTDTTSGDNSATDALLVISRVVFGDGGYVSVSNVGGTGGSLDGWQLCQRPAYYAIGPVEVAPGETVHFTTGGDVAELTGQVIDANGRFGRFSASGGEIALYAENAFGSASAIRSYVEWGSSDHGRSSVAVAAGIWTEGGFVPAEGAPGLVSTVAVPTAPEDWATS